MSCIDPSTPPTFSRLNYPTNLTKVIEDSNFLGYAIGIGLYVIPCFFFAFTSLTTSIIILCSGKCKSGEIGIITKIIYVFMITVLTGFTAAGIFFSHDITQIKTNLQSEISEVIDDANLILNSADNDLFIINYLIPVVITNISTTIRNNGLIIINGVNLLTIQIQTQIYYANRYNYSITNALRQISDNADPVITLMQDVIVQSNDSLINIQNQTQSNIADFRTQLSDAKNQIDDTSNQIEEDIFPQIDNGNKIRDIIIYTYFSFCLFFMILSIGALFFHIITIILPILFTLFIFVGFIFLGVHTLFPIVISDVCRLANDKDQTLLNETTTQRILDACLCNRNLIQALNYSDDLDFRNKIEFPPTLTTANPDQFLNFSLLFDFIDANISTLTRESVDPSYSTAETDNYLLQVNDITNPPDYFLRNNITTLNVTGYGSGHSSNLTSLKNSIIAAISSEQQLDAYIYQIQYNFSIIKNTTIDLQNNITSAFYSIFSIKSALELLFVRIDNLLNTVSCGFIGEAYINIKDLLCDKFINTTGFLALCFLHICIAFIINFFILQKMSNNNDYIKI